MHILTGILIVFLLAGHFIMVFFGISIPGIRCSRGMIIGFLGFRMLFPARSHYARGKQRHFRRAASQFSPLAMPSLAGPGAIATVITYHHLLMGGHGYDKVFAFTGVIIAILITAIISCWFFAALV